jgi:hypothetical protein
VVVEAGRRGGLPAQARTLLASRGYEIAADASRIEASAFVICHTADLQLAASRAGVPSLMLDARDPLTAYPVLPGSVFTLATAVDLDSGRQLPVSELLTEQYFRNTRNCGYRPTSAADVVAAVAEMVDGAAETDAQTRFRAAAERAGAALGPRVRHVAEWDAASGYVGDGRLARVQAERAP